MAESLGYSKLPNAPLQEVIFELRWKLDFQKETNTQVDKDFQFAFARFAELVSSKTTYRVSLKPDIIPDAIYQNKPMYQFWAGEKKYPVFQLGQGIFTVNETERNYAWPHFRSLILEGVGWLKESYSKTLQFNFIELRYIDAIETDSSEDLHQFIRTNLGLSIENKHIEKPLQDFQLHQRFKLDSENFLNLLMANGTITKTQADAIILQTAYNKTSNITADLTSWVDQAHDFCSNLFRKMISKNLYERFNETS